MRERRQIDIPFPVQGLNVSGSVRDQPPKTTIDVQNMRAFDPATGRMRGSQRGGLTKYVASQINSTARIQCLDYVTTVQSGAAAANTLSIRTITPIAVAGGTVKTFTASAVSAVTNGTTALSTTAPVIFSTSLFGNIYFADGTNEKYYDPATNTMTAWTASAGTLPVDSTNRPRLIETWRGRLVVAGIKTDPHNWFMSAVGDADDWNYSPTVEVETQAVAGNNSSAGKVGDVVTGMIPYSDDVLIFGADHSMWQMTGDPMAGGRLDLISDVTGMAWGRAWCKGPDGSVFFFGSRGGVYRMAPGQTPERISKAIEEELTDVDQNRFLIRMAWNDREIGVHVFVTPLLAGTGFHYFFDARNGSWWRDRFAEPNHNPVSVCVYDGDESDDRAILLGGGDGYIRKWTLSALSDDGTAIESYVYLGPIQEKDGTIPFVLSEVQAVLADGSATVDMQVFAGDSAENVFSIDSQRSGRLLGFQFADGSHLLLNGATPRVEYTGTLAPVRSMVVNPRTRACAAYLRLANDNLAETWAIEAMRVVLSVVAPSKNRRL